MTEEIIIDGVNVAGCEFYFEDNGVIAPDGTPERANICTSPEKSCENNDSCYCNKNCYHKQLKRLEQENKELKEKIKDKPLQCLLYNDKQNKCALFTKTVAYHCALEEIRGYFLNPNSNLELQTRQVMLIKINEVLNED